jgi:hypothetical protein
LPLQLLFDVVGALFLKFLRNNSLIQGKKLKAKQKENIDGEEEKKKKRNDEEKELSCD